MKKLNVRVLKNKKLIWSLALIPTLCLVGYQVEKDPVDRRIKRMAPEKAAQLAKAIEATVTPELAE